MRTLRDKTFMGKLNSTQRSRVPRSTGNGYKWVYTFNNKTYHSVPTLASAIDGNQGWRNKEDKQDAIENITRHFDSRPLNMLAHPGAHFKNWYCTAKKGRSNTYYVPPSQQNGKPTKLEGPKAVQTYFKQTTGVKIDMELLKPHLKRVKLVADGTGTKRLQQHHHPSAARNAPSRLPSAMPFTTASKIPTPPTKSKSMLHPEAAEVSSREPLQPHAQTPASNPLTSVHMKEMKEIQQRHQQERETELLRHRNQKRKYVQVKYVVPIVKSPSADVAAAVPAAPVIDLSVSVP